jgi:hypothetical protein
MNELWIEEPRPRVVWHRCIHRLGPGLYRAACGWEMSIHDGRLWFKKSHDVGPSEDQRCHTCVADGSTSANQ